MKIAIMTQPLGHNYGGIMQAYALQTVLKDMGHDVITIDYNLLSPNFFYKKARFFHRSVRKILGKYNKPVNIENYIPYILKNTQDFIKENISQSQYIESDKNLIKHFNKNKYDAVIVGSDQTWRPEYSVNIYNYYLNFLKSNKKIKRIAYASSFGVDSWEYSDKETKKCAKLANLFDAISVREQSGIELCEKYLGINSKCVLDPTLLLDKKYYLKLIGDRYNKDESGGVFTYFLDTNQEKSAAAQLLAKKLSTHTYNCQSRKSSEILQKYSINDYIMPPIEDWLASFANASFVLTDSFHGMVFSIVFEKPFLVIVNKERGAARFESLLSQIGGMNHLMYDIAGIDEKIGEIKNTRPLTMDKVKQLKDFSLHFLKASL